MRQSLRSTPRPERTLDERLSLRFPALVAWNARLLDRLPPTSRLRQAILRRTAELALQAYNRRDLAAVVVGADPQFEYRPNRDWVAAGLVEESYRGVHEYRRYVATVDEVWQGENRLEPLELYDLGDRLLLLATGRMRAHASGVSLTEEFAMLTTLRHGRSIVFQEYYDHDEALRAVGLSR